MTQHETQSWILQIRLESGLTQEQLSVAIGVSSSTLRGWERGKEPSMTMQQWVKFSKAVKVPLADLPIKILGAA